MSRFGPPESGAGGALHVHLEAGSVLGQPPLAAGVLDHPGEAFGPVRRPGLRLCSRLERLDVEDAGVGVLQPAEARAAQRLVGLVVGDLPEGQVQSRQVVDVDDLHLGGLVGAADHFHDHDHVLLDPGTAALQGPYTCQGKRVKSGSRFSRNASRPSTASSAMYASRVVSSANSCWPTSPSSIRLNEYFSIRWAVELFATIFRPQSSAVRSSSAWGTTRLTMPIAWASAAVYSSPRKKISRANFCPTWRAR